MDLNTIVALLIMLLSLQSNQQLYKHGNIKEPNNWMLTVYYTPVEQYHHGELEEISDEEGVIGHYPKGFLEIVRVEGVGKLSSGEHAGSYLHWTPSLGYWLTKEPLDAQGNTLIPFRTAASYSNVAAGTKVKIVDCGKQTGTKAALSVEVCQAIKEQEWIVTDRFHEEEEANHIDLYIGEEDREGFTSSSFYFSVDEANVILFN